MGDNPRGYEGAEFDGKYVYFVPTGTGTPHGEVLRYDTTSEFTSVNSWSTFDAAANDVGNNPRGFWGLKLVGNHVYFAPFHNGQSHHGEVLRYDITSEFTSVNAWSTFDASNAVNHYPKGYVGAEFDGKYVYFAPLHSLWFNGEVLRYDTTSEFTSVNAWRTFDAAANGVGDNPKGYTGAVFDGKYVYFAPFDNGENDGSHGEVLRYDTTSEFTSVNAWSTFDAASNGVGDDPRGYFGAVFDGKYVYFVPYRNELGFNGEVLRYDTTSEFTSVNAWSTFDAAANGVGDDPRGYAGAEFDGKYVYFVPAGTSAPHGEVLRYDTTSEFTSVNSWSTFDAASNGVGNNARGYNGAVFDGKYVYFAPFINNQEAHGEVLRYDTFRP